MHERALPQPTGSAVTFPGLGRLRGSGPLEVPGRPWARARVRDLTRMQAKDVDGIGASRPGPGRSSPAP